MTSRPATGGPVLRIIAIILMAGATIFNLLGGIGTFCVASNPTAWGPAMAKLASYLMLVGISIVV